MDTPEKKPVSRSSQLPARAKTNKQKQKETPGKDSGPGVRVPGSMVEIMHSDLMDELGRQRARTVSRQKQGLMGRPEGRTQLGYT